MRKQLLLSLAAFLTLQSGKTQAYKSSLTFQKNQYAAAAILVPYAEDVVTDAVKEYMLCKGFKDAHFKDFIIYRSVPLNNDASVSADTYFNISQKSHSEK